MKKEDIIEKVVEYFDGDEMAASVWVDKYALRDKNGNILESTPDEMHRRLAKELARIEQKYPNPLSEQEIYNTLKDFQYISPGGSPLFGIGNDNFLTSLSNCFVIGNNNEADSYGSIMKTDEEQVQLMKRRGGVGHDISHIRPKGALVGNSALSSAGIVPLMERYSNSTREVAQYGRRGALMLSLSINHPDAEDFIDAKLKAGKVTGANISVKITDEFMKAVEEDGDFYQTFPINLQPNISYPDSRDLEYNKLIKISSDDPGKEGYIKKIKAKQLWDKIIHNAWKSAEPGVLFINKIISESPADYYGDDWKTISTNPCFTGDMRLLTNVGEMRLDRLVGVEGLLAYNSDNKLVGCIVQPTKVVSKTVLLSFKDNVDGKIYTVRSTLDHKFPTYNVSSKATEKLGFIEDVEAKDLFGKFVHFNNKNGLVGLQYATCVGIELIEENIQVYDFTLGGDNHYGWINGVLAHNCGEIPLCPYDSCRLLSLNLYSYVENPFTDIASFNINLFKEHVRIAQRLMDDIIDLEIEKLDQIIEKIDSDPEPISVKEVELNVWQKIRDKAIRGRRTGLGVTGEGDMLAAMGLRYGTLTATDFSENVHKTMAIESYRSSIEMAKERGAFPDWDLQKEKTNPFINRIIKEGQHGNTNSGLEIDPWVSDYLKYGRRNISNLTIAPTGTTSMMTQTTSGIEPVFLPFYKRRRKTDDPSKITFTDEMGDTWEEFNVFHHKFVDWFRVYRNSNSSIKGFPVDGWTKMNLEECKNFLASLPEEQLQIIYEQSPYYKATANDVDYIEKVHMQGKIQKWIDHSISVTVNMPSDVTEQMVSDVYMEAWKSGCKGITVYRDGSRAGVLLTGKENKEDNTKFKPVKAFKRPKDVPCDIYFTKVRGEQFIVMVGIIDGYPYEVFAFKLNSDSKLDNSLNSKDIIKKGILSKRKTGWYDLLSEDKKTILVENLSTTFETPNEEDRTRLISGWLRSRGNIKYVVDILNKSKGDLTMFSKVIARILKKYIADGEKSSEKCPVCGNTLVFEEGCLNCKNCGHSKCG